jgi:hypothetical protein
MAGQPDWTVWLLALAVCALFGFFFWFVGAELLGYGRRLIDTIQNWPQIRRAMVEAEARSGGRYPFWFRAVRVFLVLAMIGLMVLLVWRKLGNFN